MAFGEYLKELRLQRGMTLRAFSQAIQEDAGNWSKIERGKMVPPRGDRLKMERIRKALDLSPDSEEWKEAVRLASIDRGELPPGILSDAEVVGKLPILFRSLEHGPVDENLLDELIEIIRRE